jgi:virginiamycin B lyase
MVVLAALLLAQSLAATPVPVPVPPRADSVQITEWPVPWKDTRPRDPYVDPTGNRVWFVGQAGHYVAYLEPQTGQFKRFELEPGTGPHNLIVDKQGFVWYAGNRASHIGRLDPKDGKITKYPMPDTSVRDPHTLVFDNKGNIWFTAQGGNQIGHLVTSSGEVHLMKVSAARSRPYGIVIDSRDRPWIALFGTNKIATVDPASMQLREFTLPEGARPRRLEVTSDGMVWYVDYARGFLGRLDPASGQVREHRMPSGAESRPYAMTVDDKDRLWFVETGVQPNRFVGFDPKTNQFLASTPVPSGGGTVRHMVFHEAGNEIWFGTDTGNIGRAKLP